MTKSTVLAVDPGPDRYSYRLSLSCGHVEVLFNRKTRPNTYEPRTGAPRLIVCTTCHPSHKGVA